MDPKTIQGRDVAYQLHPFTNLGRHEAEGPLVITRGRGVYVYDEAGREYPAARAGRNESPITLCWYYNTALGRPRKKKILSRLRAYHGVTLGAASLTGLTI